MHGHGPCMIVTHQYMQYKSSNQDWFSTISKYVAEPSATLSALPKFSQPPFACTSPYPESSGLPARVRNPEEGPEAKLISSPGQRGQRQKRKKERKKEGKKERKKEREKEKEKEDVAGDARTPDWDTTPAKDVDTSTRTPRRERKKKNMKKTDRQTDRQTNRERWLKEREREGERKKERKKERERGRGWWRTHPWLGQPPQPRTWTPAHAPPGQKEKKKNMKETERDERERERKREREKEKEKEDVAGDARTPDWDTTPAKDVDTSTRTPRRETDRQTDRQTDKEMSERERERERERGRGWWRTHPWLGHHPSQGRGTPAHAPLERERERERKKKMKERGERQIEGQARQKHPPAKITPKTSIHLIDVDLGVIFGSMH